MDSERTGYREGGKFLYGNSHGTGTAATKPDAIYAAISEALERWAWHSAYQESSLRTALRYDLDPSTTGFAAFPGLGTQGARKRAFFEAVERWSLCTWWEGRLSHKPLPAGGGLQILTPIPSCAVVVLWKLVGGLACYGFAASYSVAAATAKARIELLRNQDVLEFFSSQNAAGAMPASLNLTERRLRYFAESAGHAAFQARVSATGGGADLPSLVVDQAVPGPWTHYAHVWRCLFEGGPFRENDMDDYFLF